MRPAVIIMLKAPRAGFVKTRLTPQLSAFEAAQLAACFAQDTVRCARETTGRLIIAYAPAEGRAALEATLAGDLLWLEQEGEGLGERLENVGARAFELGYAPLIFLGADSPTLPPRYIEQAICALTDGACDLALGATEDGGYYLLGLRSPAPGLFQNIEWSTPAAYAQTARNAGQLGLRLYELPRWYDVDTYTDLLRLRTEIFSDDEARRRAPASYALLKSMPFNP
ncbi:MAG: TIGR04282 family arsenosugar biosynthesis glycosyltransferase [Acidobacteria bacterium]|nr:TIGR04282 family arsenosugar biosynthesis glycosyltransferase [Acidobacteriota bacterium]